MNLYEAIKNNNKLYVFRDPETKSTNKDDVIEWSKNITSDFDLFCNIRVTNTNTYYLELVGTEDDLKNYISETRGVRSGVEGINHIFENYLGKGIIEKY